MPSLAGRTFTVTVKDPFSFEIDADTSGEGPYTTGGYMNQVKVPVKMSFRSLREALKQPGEFLLSDFAKFDRPGLLHTAFQGLHAWRASHGSALPIPGDAAAAEEVLACARAVDAAAAEGDFSVGPEGWTPESEALVRQLACTAAGVLNPMCAFLGGVAGQEALKACSGKFTPIKQWFYFDAVEVLPDPAPSGEQVTPAGCRYDSQIVVFGRDLQAKVGDRESCAGPSFFFFSGSASAAAWPRLVTFFPVLENPELFSCPN